MNLGQKPAHHRSEKNIRNNLSPLRNRAQDLSKRERAMTQIHLNQPIRHAHLIQNCTTHPDRIAEYSYADNDDQVYYCCVCAAKLASQGFHLEKLRTRESSGGRSSRRTSENGCRKVRREKEAFEGGHSRLICKKYSKNHLIREVEELSGNVEDLLRKYENLGAVSPPDSDFERHKELINKYYEKLLDIISQYQEKHLRRLEQSGYDSIRSKIQANLHELRTISEDMCSTDFDEVMENVSEQDFRMCCEFYRTKYEDFTNDYARLTEKVEQFKKQAPYSNKHEVSEIQSTIDAIQKMLKGFYNPNPAFQPKNTAVHQIVKQYERLSKDKDPARQYQSNNPHNRVLVYPDPTSSPQFKNI